MPEHYAARLSRMINEGLVRNPKWYGKDKKGRKYVGILGGLSANYVHNPNFMNKFPDSIMPYWFAKLTYSINNLYRSPNYIIIAIKYSEIAPNLHLLSSYQWEKLEHQARLISVQSAIAKIRDECILDICPMICDLLNRRISGMEPAADEWATAAAALKLAQEAVEAERKVALDAAEDLNKSKIAEIVEKIDVIQKAHSTTMKATATKALKKNARFLERKLEATADVVAWTGIIAKNITDNPTAALTAKSEKAKSSRIAFAFGSAARRTATALKLAQEISSSEMDELNRQHYNIISSIRLTAHEDFKKSSDHAREQNDAIKIVLRSIAPIEFLCSEIPWSVEILDAIKNQIQLAQNIVANSSENI